MASPQSKDTIYIDAEDEITAVIEKVQSSKAKVVALVLPKRAPALQSIVNLKLLKRTAESAKKNLVLVTSDANLLPLAGAVGMHVAKTAQSKPTVPNVPAKGLPSDAELAEVVEAGEPPVDAKMPIGVLAGAVAAEETIDLDNDVAAEVKADKKAKKAGKKIKVPDFDRFRLMLFGGLGILLLLIIGSIFGFAILPKAHITIKTDTSTVDTNLVITAKTDAKTVDEAQLIVPAVSKQVKKTDSEKVPATGQRDDGTKASGTVTVSLTDCSQPEVTIPTGTAVTANGLSFITQASATLVSTVKGGACKNDSDASATVSVIAQNAGDKYNLGARAYVVNGFSNVSGAGSNMTGGTSKLTQVVSQQDVDGAKQKIMDRMSTAAQTDLKNQFASENYTPINDTFSGGDPAVTSSPNVNDVGSDVTVTVSMTYSQLGVKTDDLKLIVENDAKKHIDTSKQTIQDNGLSKATIRVRDNKTATGVKFQLQTTVVAGPQLDADGIKKQIAGKKKGDTQAIILARPGIKDVNIKYSPFWVYSTPKKTSKITITFDQSNGG
jgi:hypothetical protein